MRDAPTVWPAQNQALRTRTPKHLDSISIIANGQKKSARAGCPLPEFLAELRLEPERVVVERNGAALTPAEARATMLAEGDRLEIVRLVPGG